MIVIKSEYDIVKEHIKLYNRIVIYEKAYSVTVKSVKKENKERGNTFYGKEKLVF